MCMRFVYLVLGIVFNINTHKNTRERENSIKEIALSFKKQNKNPNNSNKQITMKIIIYN